MFRTIFAAAFAAALPFLGGCAALSSDAEFPAYGVVGTPQLFERMGEHARPVTTASPEAREYFVQGLAWLHAFNHDEAVRSFTRATELDPDCAMAWWGVAHAQGPNYNDAEMSGPRSAAAWEAHRQALARIESTSPVERALIEAQASRYKKPWPKDRAELDRAYADAMAEVWAAFPDDSDVGTFYAEALMILRPWDLYDDEGKPEEDTPLIVATLERVMEMDPGNPGANHLYIHAVEPSDPDLAIPAADRLSTQVPCAGHLNHMPSHIYVQTGMWERSIEQNRLAMEADALYRELSPEQGIQHGYMAHNTHMLAFSAMMVGREAEAMAAARSMWADIPEQAMREHGDFFDISMCVIYDVQKRFGRWDDLLAEPEPPDYFPITKAVWRAHRAISYAAKKDLAGAEREHEAFRKEKAAFPEDHTTFDTPTHLFLDVSDRFVAGEIALQRGELDRAAELLEEGAVFEDQLVYSEPPQWLQPIRHALGAVYLASDRPADAERTFRADLSKWRANGWSLYGLARALEEQGKSEEARAVRKEFEGIWARADEPTTTSCKCVPEV